MRGGIQQQSSKNPSDLLLALTIFVSGKLCNFYYRSSNLCRMSFLATSSEIFFLDTERERGGEVGRGMARIGAIFTMRRPTLFRFVSLAGHGGRSTTSLLGRGRTGLAAKLNCGERPPPPLNSFLPLYILYRTVGMPWREDAKCRKKETSSCFQTVESIQCTTRIRMAYTIFYHIRIFVQIGRSCGFRIGT